MREIKKVINNLTPAHLKLTLHNLRVENKNLRNQIRQLPKEIEKLAVIVNEDLHEDFTTIFKEYLDNVPPFLKMF